MTQLSTESSTFVEVEKFLGAKGRSALRFWWQGWMSTAFNVGPNTRLRVRPRLTAARWTGDVDAASKLAAVLADNAARHGKPFAPDDRILLRLWCVEETGELIIEVDDTEPAFPGFEDLATAPSDGSRPSSLWWVLHRGGRLAWKATFDDDGNITGKTVQLVLPQHWTLP
ncbi:hypothetical protein [Streptomyces sp. NPDC091217]|uniref:hypothetical protein n=1 Tax=Streptomyces sp. NPDC091217 TaxID=3365975 RepID=UPI003816D850